MLGKLSTVLINNSGQWTVEVKDALKLTSYEKFFADSPNKKIYEDLINIIWESKFETHVVYFTKDEVQLFKRKIVTRKEALEKHEILFY